MAIRSSLARRASRARGAATRRTTRLRPPARPTSSSAAARPGRSRPTSRLPIRRWPPNSASPLRSGGTWTQQTYVKASNASANDLFGAAVALSADGGTLAVGALGEASAATGIAGDQANNAAPDAGAAYVFVRSGTSWVQQAYVKASNAGEGDFFGVSLSLSADGNTLAVGAPREDSASSGINGEPLDDTAVDAGAAYVFVRSASTWSQQSYVKASNTGVTDSGGF